MPPVAQPTRSKRPVAVTAGEPEQPSKPSRPAVPLEAPPAPSPQAADHAARVSRGLLVRAPVDAAWPALLSALDELGIPVQRSDRQQAMVTTAWIDWNYDEKNQQFGPRSKDRVKWAFSLGGGGMQRHRFQLTVVPVGVDQSMVYGYHTGHQEQIDATPDSSQTLLEWVDRDTGPAVAEALLRRLRIITIP
jgi:uncharacterized lipoprotein